MRTLGLDAAIEMASPEFLFPALLSSRRLTANQMDRLETGAARLAPFAADLQSANPESDAARWQLGCIEEAAGRFAEALAQFLLVRDGVSGEERAVANAAIARVSAALGQSDLASRSLEGAARVSLNHRLLRQLDREFTRAAVQHPQAASASVRIALCGTVTLDNLAPVVRAQCRGWGIDAQVLVGGFGQYAQEILDPQSDLARFRPQVVFLLIDGDSLDPALALARLEPLWKACRDQWAAVVIQSNFEVPIADPAGRLSAASSGGRARIVRRLNSDLWETAERSQGVAVLDIDQIASSFGKAQFTDVALWRTARQYPSPSALGLLGRHVVALLRAIAGKSKKCLAVDLDGVCWGGVIGEDGLGGIVLGGSGRGEAFSEWQRYIQELGRRGVLIAACSKNDPGDARLPFREHTETVLRESDFAAFEANWEPKDANLRRIAKTLNIGLDSIVFVDDNPMERARIRQELPMVEVLDLPLDPAAYIAALDSMLYFESLSVTAEDLQRSADIRANQSRAEAQASVGGDLDSYLANLRMKVRLDIFDEKNLQRIAQLINKTNQFNLTTRRRTEAELQALMNREDVFTLSLRLEDRFGDSGLTGALIAIREADDWRIDTWLMSCRILGRRLDEAMLHAVAEHAQASGASTLTGEYIATAKNAQVAELYPRFGFEPWGDGLFRAAVGALTVRAPEFIEYSGNAWKGQALWTHA